MDEERIPPETRPHDIDAARPTKRQRYTLVACDGCKRRKIKCSGEAPCRQCVKRGDTKCVYDRGLPANSSLLLDTQNQARLLGGMPTSAQIVRSHALHPLPRLEALELLESLREDVVVLYPFIDLQEMANLVDVLYSCPRQPHNSEINMQTMRWDDMHDSRNVDFLKILLACAMTMKMTGGEDLSHRFVLTAEENNFKRGQCENVDIKDIAISAMLSAYEFRRDNLKLAWRKIGSAAKLCLELGLHRMRDSALEDLAIIHARWKTRLFWCVYVLDRRCSFMANLPFTLHDEDIDFDLLQPDKLAPYLIPNVTFGRLGAKILPVVPKFGSKCKDLDDNVRTALGRQIDHWTVTAFETPSVQSLDSPATNLNLKRLRHFKLYFKILDNQMRLSLHKHSLYTSTSVLKHESFAKLAVQAAADNIRVLSEAGEECDAIYESHGLQFRFFVVSSLVSLHIAIRTAPRQFGSAVFIYSSGLRMLKSMTVSLIASEKLRKTIQLFDAALVSLERGLLNSWGNSLPPQLDYGISSISETSSSGRKLTQAIKYIGHDWGQLEEFCPLPPELPPITTPTTYLSSCSFDPQDNGNWLTDERQEQNVPEEFSMNNFDLSDSWNLQSELFWNDEAIGNREVGQPLVKW